MKLTIPTWLTLARIALIPVLVVVDYLDYRWTNIAATAIFVFLESLDEFTGTYFVGVPDVTTMPLLMFNASMGGNYQIASITALLLLIPSIGFMLLVERFLKADVLAMVGR